MHGARLRPDLAFRARPGSARVIDWCLESRLRILLFGSLGEQIGREIDADLPAEGCSVATLRILLAERDPAFAPLARASARACVDQAIVREDYVIRPGQEVAFVPPLSGG